MQTHHGKDAGVFCFWASWTCLPMSPTGRQMHKWDSLGVFFIWLTKWFRFAYALPILPQWTRTRKHGDISYGVAVTCYLCVNMTGTSHQRQPQCPVSLKGNFALWSKRKHYREHLLLCYNFLCRHMCKQRCGDCLWMTTQKSCVLCQARCKP